MRGIGNLPARVGRPRRLRFSGYTTARNSRNFTVLCGLSHAQVMLHERLCLCTIFRTHGAIEFFVEIGGLLQPARSLGRFTPIVVKVPK